MKNPVTEVLFLVTLSIGIMWFISTLASILFMLSAAVVSWTVRGDSLRDIGLLPKNFKFFGVAMVVSFSTIALSFMIGRLLESEIYLSMIIEKLTFGYIAWAFFQQVMLNGYIANRLGHVIKSNTGVALASGSLFALAHIPNPFLFFISLIFGIASVLVFLENRNVYIVALAHGLIGSGFVYLYEAIAALNHIVVG